MCPPSVRCGAPGRAWEGSIAPSARNFSEKNAAEMIENAAFSCGGTNGNWERKELCEWGLFIPGGGHPPSQLRGGCE